MLNRRETIILTAKGLAALLSVSPFLTGCASEPLDPEDDTGDGEPSPDEAESPEPVDWSTFLADLALLAQTQFSEDWDEEAYVQDVSALMALLDLDDPDFVELYDNYVNYAQDFPEIATVHEDGDVFAVSILQFEAGEDIPLHNHPDMTGVILCVTGSVEIDNFDLLPETSENGNLLLQFVEGVTLVPGSFATLTGTRGNIHTVRATEYTELLDVFTPPYTQDRIARYRYYVRDSEPYSGSDVYEAWER